MTFLQLPRTVHRISVVLVFIALAGNAISQTAAPAPKKPPVRKAPAGRAKRPMTEADVQKLWSPDSDALLTNEIRLRGLAFEPEGAWLEQLAKSTGVTCAELPSACSALQKLIPPPPDVDEVAKQAPGILTHLKDAAQKKSVSEMQALVDPALLADKAKIYELFDPSNYRGHTLGRFTTEESRVGVQFFQLTMSQVETLHYIWFSTVHGKIVVRDIESGPQVAERFLHDEEKVALAKLSLVFRALNDGDEAGLKTLCTPGLYQSIQELGGDKHPGDRVTRGRNISQVSLTPSVPLDQKSIRVVVRVSYPLRSGKPLEFNVDFERIDNDLKVVRLRDVENHVIAWDPDIDNYLNRRYGIPDAPKQVDVAKTTNPAFLPLDTIRTYAKRAVEDRKAAELTSDAQEIMDSAPQSGEGEGFLASASYLLGKDDDAEKQAMLAIDRGGTVYLTVLRHSAFNLQGQPFSPVVLSISRDKILYSPPSGSGGASEEIPMNSLTAVEMERNKDIRGKRPFLKIEFRANGKKQAYNFAAFGTTCPGKASGGTDLVPWQGTSVCGLSQTGGTTAPTGKSKWGIPTSFPLSNSGAAPIPTMVPRTWEQDLKVVMRSIEEARNRTSAQK